MTATRSAYAAGLGHDRRRKPFHSAPLAVRLHPEAMSTSANEYISKIELFQLLARESCHSTRRACGRTRALCSHSAVVRSWLQFTAMRRARSAL